MIEELLRMEEDDTGIYEGGHREPTQEKKELMKWAGGVWWQTFAY